MGSDGGAAEEQLSGEARIEQGARQVHNRPEADRRRDDEVLSRQFHRAQDDRGQVNAAQEHGREAHAQGCRELDRPEASDEAVDHQEGRRAQAFGSR